MFNLRLLFVALVWGVNFSVVKFALTDFHPLGFTMVRFTLAALFLFVFMLVNRLPFTIKRHDRWKIVRLGFIGITLYNLFFMYGLKYTTAANSALLISLSPLFAAVIQAASGKERLSGRIAAGLVLSSLGVFFIIRSHQGEPFFSSARVGGDLLTLCATFSWAFYTIWAQPLLEKYSAVTITAYSMFAGALLLFPLSLPGLVGQRWGDISGPSWFALLFAAFIAGGVAYVFWYHGVKQLGVTRTMAYHYLMPFAAVLFAATILGEKITVLQAAGGIAVLTGVSLVQSKNRNT
jgi:drug/metabolite transporter (DMT)-like permease